MNSSTRRTIALIDFRWEGHHPTFFRFFYDALAADPRLEVVCFCPEPDSFIESLAAGGSHVSRPVIELLDEVLEHRWLRKAPALANWFRFHKCAGAVRSFERASGRKVDLVFFACLYNGAFLLPRWLHKIFPFPWTGLLLDSTCCRWGFWKNLFRARTTDALAMFRARNCRSLATLDGFIANDLARRLGGRRRVCVLPEIVDHEEADLRTDLARRILAQADGRPVISSFGQFARRKGALEFIAVAEACEDESWFFVWTGAYESESFSQSERRRIERYRDSHPPNCLIEFGRIGRAAEFNGLVQLSSVLFLCYSSQVGSSNMIGKATQFGKPVIVTEGYCMADMVNHFHIGSAIGRKAAPQEYREAIRRLLETKTEEQNFEMFRSANSEAEFAVAVRAMIGLESQLVAPV